MGKVKELWALEHKADLYLCRIAELEAVLKEVLHMDTDFYHGADRLRWEQIKKDVL